MFGKSSKSCAKCPTQTLEVSIGALWITRNRIDANEAFLPHEVTLLSL
jgi:hypothetical protein